MGVESVPETAEVARKRLDQVVVADAELVEAADVGIEPGTVDCLVYGDVLQCLIDPWSLLRRHVGWLRPEGTVIACIPNVQHWSMLVRLLRGNWEYEPEGPLDRTTCRFFTLDSIARLFSQVGLRIFDVQGRNAVGSAGEFQQFQDLLAPAVRALGLDANRFAQQTAALQYVVRALKASVPVRQTFVHTLICEGIVTPRIRVQEPNRFLNTIPGVQATESFKSVQFSVPQTSQDKVFIWHRAIIRPAHDFPVIKELLRHGFLIVGEMDDDPNFFPEHPASNFLSFRGVHCIQTSTEPLAEVLRQYNPNVAVFPNQLAYLPPPRTYTEDGPIRLFFGAVNRENDWKPILPVLNRILREYGSRIYVDVIHDQKFYEALQTQAKSYESFCLFQRYEEVLSRCDIALLPLEANRFNSLKSDLKWVECAGYGVVALASPTVYERSIVHGETGFLYRSAREFEELLRELIANRELRRQVTRQAYKEVKNKRLFSQHYRTRHEWYLQLVERLPQLTAELRRRVPELA